MADFKGRNEFNVLPGYTRAQRFRGNHPSDEAAFDALECGLTARNLEEFLREPSEAAARNLISKAVERRAFKPALIDKLVKDLEGGDLLTIVIKMATVVVLADRETAEREEQLRGRRAA